MRSISGARNRLVLIVASVVALAAAAWLGVAVLDLTARWPQAEALLPHADSTLAAIAAHHRQWLLPAAVAVSLLASAVGIALMLAQVPSRPAATTLRILDADGTELGSLEPAVLERVLVERLEALAGITDASVRIGGAASSPWLQARVTLADDAEVERAAGEARRMLAEDTSTVLGTAVQRVDLLLRLGGTAAPAHTTVEPAAPGTAAAEPAPA